MKWFLKFVLPLLALHFYESYAEEVQGEIISSGIYEVPTKQRLEHATQAVAGIVRVYQGEPVLLAETNQITAKIGTDFGFIYKIVNLPMKDGEEIELEKTVKTPGIKQSDGTIKTLSVWRLKKTVNNGCVVDYSGFGFDNDQELVPGTWQFEVKYKDKVLCAKTFTVVQ